MMRLMLVATLLVAVTAQPGFAEGNADQQQKDFEQKQRIYGTKHPWENTAPYGTQYTPPQAGVGGSSDSDSGAESKPETKPPTKPDTKSARKSTTKSVSKKKTKSKKAPHKAAGNKQSSAQPK